MGATPCDSVPPLGSLPGVNPSPGWPPVVLGFARVCWEYLLGFAGVLHGIFTEFYRLFGLSWEDNTTLHVAVRTTACFFSRLCPPGESDNKRSGARRGEFDSSTPEAIGVLLGYIFLA